MTTKVAQDLFTKDEVEWLVKDAVNHVIDQAIPRVTDAIAKAAEEWADELATEGLLCAVKGDSLEAIILVAQVNVLRKFAATSRDIGQADFS